MWFMQDKPQTRNWESRALWEMGTSEGFPCSSKHHNCMYAHTHTHTHTHSFISRFSRWNKAKFASCLSYFSLPAESTLGPDSSNLSLLYAWALFSPAAHPLSHRCGHKPMTTSCCFSLIPPVGLGCLSGKCIGSAFNLPVLDRPALKL